MLIENRPSFILNENKLNMTMPLRNMPSPRNPFTKIYSLIALDYFYQMGGSGRYIGFQDWHPALLTLACALEATEECTPSELDTIWSNLPIEISQKCDGLREKVTEAFKRELEPFEFRVDCIKAGANELLKELSTGRRGKPLSFEENTLYERVKLEFHLAFSSI